MPELRIRAEKACYTTLDDETILAT